MNKTDTPRPRRRGLNESVSTQLHTAYAARSNATTTNACAAKAPTGTTTGGVSRQRNVAQVPQNNPSTTDHVTAGHGRVCLSARGTKWHPTQTEIRAWQE